MAISSLANVLYLRFDKALGKIQIQAARFVIGDYSWGCSVSKM